MYDEDPPYYDPGRQGPSTPTVVGLSILCAALTFVGMRHLEASGLLAFALPRPAAPAVVAAPVAVAPARPVVEPVAAPAPIEAPAPVAAPAPEPAPAPAPVAPAVAADPAPAPPAAAPAGKLPKVVGMKLPKARRALEEAGFKVGSTRYKYDETKGSFVVLRQSPGDGTLAAPGTEVHLVVNQGD